MMVLLKHDVTDANDILDLHLRTLLFFNSSSLDFYPPRTDARALMIGTTVRI